MTPCIPETFQRRWSTGASSRATRCRREIPTTMMMMMMMMTTNRQSLENPRNRAKAPLLHHFPHRLERGLLSSTGITR
jgi:hypothetical protein